MLIAHGTIHERPWGRTLGSLARRGVSGQLAIESDGLQFELVFDRGHVVAATSPLASDTLTEVASRSGLIGPEHAATVRYWLANDPTANEAAMIASVAGLGPAEKNRLDRRALAQCAARTFALEHGEFVLSTEVSIPVPPHGATHAGGIIYVGARTNMSEARLLGAVRTLGTRFELHRNAIDELADYGFGDAERSVLRALADGIQLAAIEAIQVAADRQLALATIYALASCGALYCEAPNASGRLARGTATPLSASTSMPAAGRQSSSPSFTLSTEPVSKASAEAAFRDGQLALQHERMHDALADFSRAAELDPSNVAYQTALAWARFCAASNKSEVASDVRRSLERAINRTEEPVEARCYLGVVERMLGRDAEALRQFQAVLALRPGHAESAAEVRTLLARRSRKR